ncbi:MAG: acyltransferase [Alistipes sp.]|nr:acyltransferase [Alistipes sp.]
MAENPTERNSSIELLRIVAMFLIVLHHYCVNSGLIELMDPHNLTGNTILIQFLSFGGKVGVNIFFLICGYFMIGSKMKWNKVAQLFFQILTINIFVCLFLSSLGYRYGVRDYVEMIPFFFSMPTTFISSYLVIYILTPVINKALSVFDRSEYRYLLIVLLGYFCIAATFLFQTTWHYMGWAFTLYCVGGYIRKYELTSLNWKFGWISLGLLAMLWGAILFFDYLAARFDFVPASFWTFAITDANKITVFALALALFMYFLKLRSFCCKTINFVGGGICFGVLLWHANNDIMRRWLWTDFLGNTDWFSSDYLWLHCLLSVIGVYGVCTILELIRQYVLEKPVFNVWNRYRAVRATCPAISDRENRSRSSDDYPENKFNI